MKKVEDFKKKWKKLFQGKPVSRPNTVSSELTEARGLSGQLQNISFLLKLRDLCMSCFNQNSSESI